MVDTGTKSGKAAFIAALAAVVTGVCVLVGWLFDLESVKRIAPGFVAMNPVAAVAFILAGASLALFLQPPHGHGQKSRLLLFTARLCALAVALIGLAKLLGLLGGGDMGVDQWLFTSKLPGELRFPSRMAPNAALNFFLLGGALLFADAKKRSVRLTTEFAVGVVGFGSLLAVLGYAYGVQSFYQLGSYIPMALHSALTFSVLVTAFSLAHTDRGFLSIFIGNCAAGTLGRRLLPAVVLIPAAFGWLELHGELRGIYDSRLGNALFAVGNIVIFTLLVCWIASALSHADRSRTIAEKSLQRQKTELRALFDLMPALIWFKDTENRILLVNQRLAEAAGKTVAEIEGKSARDIYPQDAARYYADDLEVIRLGVPKLGSVEQVRDLAGKDHWLQTDKVPYFDKDGKVIGIVAMAQDITERKWSENALRESEERFRSYFELGLIGMAISSPAKGWLEVNDQLCRMFGYGRSELLQTTWAELTHPDDLPADLANFNRVLTGELDGYSMNKRFVRKDGQIIDTTLSVKCLRRADSSVDYFVVLLQDITARKQTEAARDRLAAIVEHSAEAIISKTLDGIVTSWNPAAGKMLGYTAAEMIGQPLLAIIPDDRLNEEAEILASFARGELVRHVETVRVRKDGQRFEVSATISAIKDADGSTVGISKIIRDITERRRLEGQLFQSQKLETVGKLAGGIAHEFNSILTAIIGQSELLLHDLPAGSPLVKNATEISRAAERAAALTRQLLAYGRKLRLEPEILDLNAILAGMESTLRHLAGRSVDVRLVPAAGLRTVRADAAQIEQVITNMAINARAAMPNGGKLTLETANVSFDLESVGRHPELKPGDYVMLAITDTGAGMSAEVKARAFEPFFTTKAVGQGTGLGLSTCYGIIKQSGGHISLYSEPAHGANFKIYLPQVESPAKPPAPQFDLPALPRGTETILLVEDDPALREMAATLLKRLGYTVWTAANGAEALSLKQQHDIGQVDLVFTDVVMPHMTGKELAGRVRALYPATKILFTSAYTENAIVHQGVLDQGTMLLEKPFTPSALARKLREALDQPGPE